MSGLRAGAAYIDVHGRLARDFDRDIEKEGSSRLGGVGDKLGGVLAGGMAAAGVTAGALLVEGLTTAIDNEKVTDRLAAQIGGGSPAAEMAGKVAGSLYANAYGDSLGEVADAVNTVWKNGLLAEDSSDAAFEALTAKALDFTTIFSQDMETTTAAVGQMLRTGLVDDADEAFDLLTRGAQQGTDKAGDLVDTMNEYSTQFRQLGLGGADAMGLLTQGVKAGARDADIVADALKEFAIRAQDGSATTAAGFKALGLEGEEMAAKIAAGGPGAAKALDLTLDKLREIKDPAKQAQTAVALFGTQSEDLQDALYALDPSNAVMGLGNIEGAADRAGTTLNDNLGSKIESLKRRGLQALANFIGEKVVPAIEAFLPVVQRTVDGVVAKWPAIQAAIQPVIEKIVALVEEKWPAIAETVEEVMTTVSEIVSGVLELVTLLWDNFGAYIIEFLSSTFDAVLQIIGGAMKIIQGIIDVVMGILTGDWSRAWDGIKSILSGAWDVIMGVIKFALARVKLVLQVGLKILKGLFSGAWKAIKEGVSRAFNGMVDFFSKLPGRLAEVGKDVFGFLWDSFKDALNMIIRGWNSLEFKIPGFKLGPVGYDGFTLGVPDIPEFRDQGGPTWPGRSYLIGAGQTELFSPGRGHVTSQADLIKALEGGGSRAGTTIEKVEVHGGDLTASELVDAVNTKLGWTLTTRNDR